MTPATTPEEGPAPARDVVADVTALCSTVLGHAALAYWLIGKSAYSTLLGLDVVPPARDERWLIALTVVGNTVLFMLPGLTLAVALSLFGRRSFAFVACAVVGGLGAALCTVDLAAYAEFGRHLSDILRFLALPKGHVAAGDSSRWVWRVLALAAASVGFTALGVFALQWLLGRALGSVTRAFRVTCVLVAGGVCLVLGIAPPLLAGAWRHSIVLERLFAALPVDLRRHSDDPRRFTDPLLGELATALSAEYRTAFPRLYVERETTTVLATQRKPNVIVIVLESWRPDALRAALMPRLDAWANRGLRLNRHYAGSTYSEAGLFSLLYGRSALEYHATLDRKLKPELCQLLRKSGYECAYFSGQPRHWMRQEEFVAPETFDRFVHDDRGSWVEWDRRALGSLVAEARKPRDKPLFALVFLMSSHFEYQYPPEFERHRPTDAKVRFGVTKMASLGAEAAVPLMNRYKNSMAFMDAVVGDALDQLPPSENLVVVTGDHGESIHDDGRFGHGYSFAEVIARTPAFVVGPGFQPRVVDSPSLHSDFLPTLARALSGAAPSEIERLGGRDLLGEAPPRTSQLLAHCSWNGNEADVLLVSGSQRLRLELDLRKPRVTVKGFEDELGHLLAHASSSREAVDRLRADFASELLSLSAR